MTDTELLARVDQMRGAFGASCKKMSRAVAAETIREALVREGFSLSRRDVYIRGVPLEVDLLVLKPRAKGELDLVFDPDDVLAAIEVKASGVFNGEAAAGISRCFQRISRANSGICCCYVTLVERLSYKHRITPERLGFPAYTFFGHTTKMGQDVQTSTGDWYRLIWDLKRLSQQQ